MQNVCDSENSEEKTLTKFTEEEIWEKCHGFKFAQITETCGSNRRGKILCCNEISENSTGKSFLGALILASVNPQYDDRLFIEWQVDCWLQEEYKFRTCFVQNLGFLFWHSKQ